MSAGILIPYKMAEGAVREQREAAACQNDTEDDMDTDDIPVHVLSSEWTEAIARSIVESEEWPRYMEELRRVGDDEQFDDLSKKPNPENGPWVTRSPLLTNQVLGVPTDVIVGSISDLNNEHVEAPNEYLEGAAAVFPHNPSLRNETESVHSVPLWKTCSIRSSCKALDTSPVGSVLLKLSVVPQKQPKGFEDNAVRCEADWSSSPSSTSSCCTSQRPSKRSNNSAPDRSDVSSFSVRSSIEWSPEVEQFRAAMTSSGSSGDCDLVKSTFYISRTRSVILALEHMFVGHEQAICEKGVSPHASCSPAELNFSKRMLTERPSEEAALGVPRTDEAVAEKRLPLQRLGRGAFGRVFGVHIKGECWAC